jgi:hypothetical protein
MHCPNPNEGSPLGSLPSENRRIGSCTIRLAPFGLTLSQTSAPLTQPETVHSVLHPSPGSGEIRCLISLVSSHAQGSHDVVEDDPLLQAITDECRKLGDQATGQGVSLSALWHKHALPLAEKVRPRTGHARRGSWHAWAGWRAGTKRGRCFHAPIPTTSSEKKGDKSVRTQTEKTGSAGLWQTSRATATGGRASSA